MNGRGNVISLDQEAQDLFDRIEDQDRESLILRAWPSPRLAMVLAACINRRIARGKNCAILAESSIDLDQIRDIVCWLNTDTTEFQPRFYTRREFLAALDGTLDKSWFEQLDMVLIPCVEDTLMRPFEWQHLGFRIMDRCVREQIEPPQFVLVCAPRRWSEESLRRNFPVFSLNNRTTLGIHKAHDISLAGEALKNLWWTFWAAEEDYLQKLFMPMPGVDYGAEPILGYYTGRRGIAPSHYFIDGSIPIEDQLETLQHRLSAERMQPWNQVMHGREDGVFLRKEACGAETIRDAAANPWRVLRAQWEKGGQALMCNIVMPPTLLREYLIANGSYFARMPLEPLTPRLLGSLNDRVAQLYLRLNRVGAKLLLDEVRGVFSGFLEAHGEADSFHFLRECLRENFGAAVAGRLRLVSEDCWCSASDRQPAHFERMVWVVLDSGLRADGAAWLRELNVIDESQEIHETVRLDHVYQLYPPGQTCTVSGKLFRVERIDEDNDLVVLRKIGEPHTLYRSQLTLSLLADSDRRILVPDDPSRLSGAAFHKEVFELHFRVATSQCWFSENSGIRWNKTGSALPDREYRRGRGLRLRFLNGNGDALWTNAQRQGLALLLREAIVTLFPESHRFLIVAAQVPEDFRPQTDPAKGITSILEIVGTPDEADCDALWLFEDSHSDLGLVGACHDHAEWLLSLCLDYLVWRFDEQQKPLANHRFLWNTERPGRDFLAFGAEAVDPAFDLEGLREMLAESGLISEQGSLTAVRRWIENNPAMAASGGNGSGDTTEDGKQEGSNTPADENVCDFCGNPGLQGVIIDDGRFRCSGCCERAVDTVEEAQQICDQVLSTLRSVHGLELGVSVKAEFVDALTLAQGRGASFIPTSGYDARALGYASFKQTVNNQEYRVVIEHGHSPESTAMTFAHEFAHIWQFAQLDYERLGAEYGMLIEGAAVWLEIAYARTTVKQEKDRQKARFWRQALENYENGRLAGDDDYAKGYRQLLEIVGSGGDALGWLARMYGKK